MRRVLFHVVRLVLAAVFLWAAVAKLREPWLIFAASIDSMQILPEPAVLFVARVLPWAELALGVLLVFSIQMRYVASFATVLLAVFLSILLWSYARGLQVDCGCFGPGESLGALTLARDAALVAASCWMNWESFRREPSAQPAFSLQRGL